MGDFAAEVSAGWPIFVDLNCIQGILMLCWLSVTPMKFVSGDYDKFTLGNTEKAVFGRDFNRSKNH